MVRSLYKWTEVETTKNENVRLSGWVNTLECQLNDKEQLSRRLNWEVLSGIADTESDNAMTALKRVVLVLQ